ncbi:hypothetical protein M0812_08093 [Anaeramoeba flamelloides]|uniref:Uncharacterized protein n=1 Tax=Anaeramoeba flamelloides TaxID=1746091 RepID=A0AAV8A2H5_9EUKA|nr:hypothetical protein M0812_08093 [Anaeramoeba flamelloides]
MVCKRCLLNEQCKFNLKISSKNNNNHTNPLECLLRLTKNCFSIMYQINNKYETKSYSWGNAQNLNIKKKDNNELKLIIKSENESFVFQFNNGKTLRLIENCLKAFSKKFQKNYTQKYMYNSKKEKKKKLIIFDELKKNNFQSFNQYGDILNLQPRTPFSNTLNSIKYPIINNKNQKIINYLKNKIQQMNRQPSIKFKIYYLKNLKKVELNFNKNELKINYCNNQLKNKLIYSQKYQKKHPIIIINHSIIENVFLIQDLYFKKKYLFCANSSIERDLINNIFYNKLNSNSAIRNNTNAFKIIFNHSTTIKKNLLDQNNIKIELNNIYQKLKNLNNLNYKSIFNIPKGYENKINNYTNQLKIKNENEIFSTNNFFNLNEINYKCKILNNYNFNENKNDTIQIKLNLKNFKIIFSNNFILTRNYSLHSQIFLNKYFGNNTNTYTNMNNTNNNNVHHYNNLNNKFSLLFFIDEKKMINLFFTNIEERNNFILDFQNKRNKNLILLNQFQNKVFRNVKLIKKIEENENTNTTINKNNNNNINNNNNNNNQVQKKNKKVMKIIILLQNNLLTIKSKSSLYKIPFDKKMRMVSNDDLIHLKLGQKKEIELKFENEKISKEFYKLFNNYLKNYLNPIPKELIKKQSTNLIHYLSFNKNI